MTLLDDLERLEEAATAGPWFVSHARSVEPGQCWEWRGARLPSGYGRSSLDGRDTTAHRAAWAHATGNSPARNLCVCHRCDNPGCINPDHLFVGTPSDNARDMISKGRHSRVRNARQRESARRVMLALRQRGYVAPSAKLTPDAVRQIRAAVGFQRAIAERFGVVQSLVSQIKRGVIWKAVV